MGVARRRPGRGVQDGARQFAAAVKVNTERKKRSLGSLHVPIGDRSPGVSRVSRRESPTRQGFAEVRGDASEVKKKGRGNGKLG